MHILVLTVPVKAERLKCSEYNFAPQHIGAAGNLSCIAFGVGNKIWIASANILLSPNDWKILANFTLLNTLMICSSYFSSVLLFMCPHQKRKVGRRQFKFLSHCKLWFVFAVRICFLGTFGFLLKNEDCCNSNQNVNLNSFVTVWALKQQKKMVACTMTKILSKL